MKILCVIDSLGSGGAQRQLVELGKGFKYEGHEVVFLVYHSINFFKSELEEVNIPVILIHESNYLKRLLKIRSAIRNQKPNAVLSFLEGANFISTCSGFPYRKWILVVGERSANPSILNSFKRRVYCWFHVFTDHVVSNSYENLQMVRSVNALLPGKKCHVIYNLIDFEKWKPTSEVYQLKENDKFNLTVVASHQHLKNLKGLIEAVALLSDSQQKTLIINWYGGSGMDNSKKEALALIETKGLGEIFNFHNPTSDIHNKVKQADALGLFSFYEGLPNTVCEAMTAGKPVISAKVSDIPLLIKNSEMLFDPTSSLSISKSLKFVIDMTEVELNNEGQINRKNATKLFDRQSILKDYLKLLKK